MKWSNDPPTEPGWYWERRLVSVSGDVCEKSRPIQAKMYGDELCNCSFSPPHPFSNMIDEMMMGKYQWWTTPITPPQEEE